MRAHRRLLIGLTFLIAAWAAPVPREAAAEPAPADTDAITVFVVRHAERSDIAPAGEAQPSMGPAKGNADPGLSAAGRARAARLAAMLAASRVERIFTTEYARTRLTAEPLAKASGVSVVSIPTNDLAALIARLSEPGGPALVVGHSNTVPDIVKGLGVSEPVQIADDEYDNLFVVVRHAGASQLVRLKF